MRYSVQGRLGSVLTRAPSLELISNLLWTKKYVVHDAPYAVIVPKNQSVPVVKSDWSAPHHCAVENRIKTKAHNLHSQQLLKYD